jgi:hypothetical protein
MKAFNGHSVITGMETKTAKATLKKRMLNKCIAKQQSLIEDFKKRIEALLVTEGLGNEESYDNSELAHASMNVNEARALSEALQYAEDEMKQLWFLQLIPNKINTKAEQGAAVVTNSGTFYISVSIEQFKVDGETYIGLSVHSPLYLAMKGKAVGETFTYNGREYSISDIF